jgi:uncharacterized protein
MTRDTAFTAIDAFLAGHSGRRPPKIGFYGGEPLLALDLVLECMSHAREKDKRCVFSLTTNGTLLTLETFRKLRPFAPSLGVSLDGPAPVHDRQRPTIGQRGTHARVMANLKAILDNDPPYFRRSISLLGVIGDRRKIPAVSRFFRENTIAARAHRVLCGPVNQRGIAPGHRDEDLAHIDHLPPSSRKRLARAIATKDPDAAPVELSVVNSPLQQVIRRKKAPVPRLWVFRQLCALGAGEVIVSADGDYRGCEKTSCLPSIGSIGRGLDPEAILGMEDDFLQMSGPCRECWALRMCKVCYQHIYSIREDRPALSHETMRVACEDWKERLEASLALVQARTRV